MPDKMVTLKLAHPLDDTRSADLRAKVIKDYQVGDEITVPPDEARALIASGYALGVEPADSQAVAKALGISAAEAKAATPGTVPAAAGPAAKASDK